MGIKMRRSGNSTTTSKEELKRALCLKSGVQVARGPSGFPCSVSPWYLPLGCATARATLGFPRALSLGFHFELKK